MGLANRSDSDKRSCLNAQVAAALENALLEPKARALGVPMFELFGGAVRKKILVYVSHTGMNRMRRPDLLEAAGASVPRRMEDMTTLGAEVAARRGRAQDQPALLRLRRHPARAHALLRPRRRTRPGA